MRPTFATPSRPEILEALLDGWTTANVRLIQLYGLPPLYESGVRYRREPRGRERWQLAPTTASLGYGDCEDLATWRAAELRLDHGIPAYAAVYRAGPRLLHVVVRFPDGSIEDPSRILGMGRKR